MSQTLSLAEARRIALAAQLFVPAVAAPKGAAALGKIVHRLGAVQIDSVNVLVRSHYLPIYSRCGSYAPELLERAAYGGSRSLFEYWGHEASFLPVDLYPLFRWRMERARNGEGTWKRLRRYATSHKQLVTAALEQIRERGALGASELADCGKSKGSWWGWSQGKEILEWLFWIGDVTTARRRNFERLYDLTERVLPERVRTASVPSPEQARRELMAISARALGVATARDLRDYFRLPAADAATRVAELVEEGTLQPVVVEGWKHQAYLHADAVCPRRVDVGASAIAVRFADLGTPAHASACSAFISASKSTRRSTSACTATTCCRSCLAIGWSAASISRPTDTRRAWKCAAAAWKKGCVWERSWSRWQRSCGSSLSGSGWKASP